jgi:hypothetical protein
MLCFGPNRGPKITYTNPHRLLPGFRPAAGETALRTLVTRYLYAYGPATPQHFARWLSIPPQRAVELFDQLAGELESVELDGAPASTLAGDTATPPRPHREIRLRGHGGQADAHGGHRDRRPPRLTHLGGPAPPGPQRSRTDPAATGPG